jgi:hypothetical protein
LFRYCLEVIRSTSSTSRGLGPSQGRTFQSIHCTTTKHDTIECQVKVMSEEGGL